MLLLVVRQTGLSTCIQSLIPLISFHLVCSYDSGLENVAGVGLNVCEWAGKAKSPPGRRVSSHSCLTKVL